MEENNYFYEDKLEITFDKNTFNLHLKYAKGNIGNILNFIIFALSNSGMQYDDIYHELANYVRHKIEDYHYANEKIINPFNDEAK